MAGFGRGGEIGLFRDMEARVKGGVRWLNIVATLPIWMGCVPKTS